MFIIMETWQNEMNKQSHLKHTQVHIQGSRVIDFLTYIYYNLMAYLQKSYQIEFM